jgi:hypothetical protein
LWFANIDQSYRQSRLQEQLRDAGPDDARPDDADALKTGCRHGAALKN